jgi:alkanesulfonate monooxygenase SsuD/methylene tetrahydromethanopterin reductase-like flavin-dependent oxidoreductase (luciferase family)
VSSGTDGTIRLVDVKTRSVAGILPGPDNTWVAAIMDPVGQRLVAEYATGQAFDWTVNPDDWARQACAVAGRSLTQAEWDQYLPTTSFDPSCGP